MMNFAIFVALALGILFGYIFARLINPKSEIVGTLKIIEDEDGPYLFADLNEDPRALEGKKKVTMYVKREKVMSHK